jgi:hypothetical protein
MSSWMTGIRTRCAGSTLPLRVVNPAQARLTLTATQLIPYRDWIEVEVLDPATDQPLAGYARTDCIDVTREGLRIPVRWGEQNTLGGVTASEIKLRFYLYGKAKLYSFTFVP